MKVLLYIVAALVALGYVLVGYGAAPAYAATFNCVWTPAQFGYGTCTTSSGSCTPSPNPCETVDNKLSQTKCEGTTYTCSDPQAEGNCPSETITRRDAAQCSGLCTSGQCVADSEGVRRCCVVFDSSSPSACPNGTATTYGSSTQCAQGCSGDCVNDNSGVKRCCLSATSSGGGTQDIPGIDLPEKEECVETGLGCIPTDPAKLAGWVLGLGTGLGALLAVLFLIIGGFGVATSGGNPDNLEAAKKRITAAIAGLLFILLTGLILRTIGDTIGIDIKLFGVF